MQNYKCFDCATTFADADKAWDIAIDTGRCPKCHAILRNFPVPVRQQKENQIRTPISPSLNNAHSTLPSSSDQKCNFCSNCGTKTFPMGKFCSNCGAGISAIYEPSEIKEQSPTIQTSGISMFGLLRLIRGFCGFLFAMQIIGLIPVLSWLQQPNAVTGGMLVTFLIKLLALAFFGWLFFWLRSSINRLHTPC